MDYLKSTPGKVNWSPHEHHYPGLVEKIFDPERIAAPYIITNTMIGYCDLAFFWLASQPNEEFFQQMMQLRHQPGTFTDRIYHQKKKVIPNGVLHYFPSEHLDAAKKVKDKYGKFHCNLCINPYIDKMVFHSSMGFTSIVEVVYLLATTPGRFLITLICQNQQHGENTMEAKHCFALYHQAENQTSDKNIRIFDYRFGGFKFTDQFSIKLHALISTLSNYYIGNYHETTFCMTIHQAHFPEADQQKFVDDFSERFLQSTKL